MAEYDLGEVQEKFANLIWDNEPVASGELVKLCEEELGWKKPTTYTVLRKLCEKGLFQNVEGIVTSLVSRQEFHLKKSRHFVEKNYDGSLPAFVAAFISGQELSEKEAREIRNMIEAYEKKAAESGEDSGGGAR